MDFEIKSCSLAQAAAHKVDLLVVLASHKEVKQLGTATDAISSLLRQAYRAADFAGSAGQTLMSYGAPGLLARRIVLAGLGETGAQDGASASAREVSKAVASALGGYKPSSPPEKKSDNANTSDSAGGTVLIVWLNQPEPDALQAAVHAASSANYQYDHTKSKKTKPRFAKVTFGVAKPASLRAAFDEAKACAEGVNIAREWGNRPANHATPTLLAKAAQSLAAGKSPIRCEVLGPQEVAKLKMGAFMAVAQGSNEPLRFIVLKYFGAAKSQAPQVLIGKGITFDTGGISIKPAAEMDEMKFDMCGAASVLGVFKALSLLKPTINVVGLIPACENMPSGRAVKPGDVVKSMSGQTIEILNTDAEGRLILCDALTYAERFKPAAVIDIATLTGACVVALGNVRSGLFSTDDALAASLLQAGEAALDFAWRMPLDDDYADGLKTNFADVANVAGRAGGAITAAKFLQRFASKFAWAHLDIAGTAWKGGSTKGATGRPVPLLMKYLLQSSSGSKI